MWAPQYGAQNVPYFQYGRGKRAIDPPTQEEMKQFAGHIAEFKGQLEFLNDILLIRDTGFQSCNRRFGRETIHPTKKFTSMKLLQISCMLT